MNGNFNMNKDRFDLENEIMNLYSTVTDLEAVADTLYDSKKKYTEDEIHTTLRGLANVLDAKIVRLEDVFCQVFELNEYSPEEVKRYREKFLERAEELRAEPSDR
jgi:Fe-S-cluster formation regulator IscX/YfhJ